MTRWIWRLAVLVAIVVAVAVSAGREMAPLLHEHKGWLEANLTASTGQMVTMQEVHAYWEGLVPELAVKQLTISNSLQVDNALMRVDLLGSAKAFALVFDTLDINGASVKIPVGLPANEEMFNVRAYLEFLFGSADIRVRNLQMVLQHSSNNQLLLQVDELTVQNDQGSHWLNGIITVGEKNNAEKKSPVQIIMKFKGDASDIFSGRGRAHVNLGDEKNLQLLQQFLYRISDDRALNYAITGMESAGGQIWASWQEQRVEWVSETSIKGLTLVDHKATDTRTRKKMLANNSNYRVDFSGKLAGHVLTEDMSGKEYFLHVMPDQEVFINQRRYPLPVLGLQYKKMDASVDNALFDTDKGSESHLVFYLPDLKLGTMTEYLDLLPSQYLRDILKKLNPSGNLKNVLVSIPVKNAVQGEKNTVDNQNDDVLVQANLNKVSVSAWEGAPALALVDGYIEASPDSGFVELDSQQGFSMHYPVIYRGSMKYNRAFGRVHWTINPYDKHVYVGSSGLDLRGDEGELRGAFWLDIPPAHSQHVPELYLAVSLINTHVKYRNKYLPYILNTSLKQWLDSSIKDGNMRECGFIYRGSLHEKEAQEHTLVFYGKVKNADLQFDPAWPALKNMDALVLVDNENMHANIKSARFLGFSLSKAMADVRVSGDKQGHFMSLQADAAGPANDAFTILRDTPLRKTFGDVFDGWQFSGDAKGHLRLGVRIGLAEQQDFQEIDLRLGGNDLLVGGINLPLQQLKGDIHYSSTAGLSSTPLNASLWGQDQLINIVPSVDGDGQPDMTVSMLGNIDPQAVAPWAHLPFVHFFQGAIPFDGKLNIPLDIAPDPAAPVGNLFIHSDMQGVSLDLPSPLKKSPDERLPATMSIDFWKDRQHYDIKYGNMGDKSLVLASVDQKKNERLKGDISINQSDNPVIELPDFLRVRAELDQALLSDWLPVMERHTAFIKVDEENYKKIDQGKEITSAGVSTATYPVFDLLIKQLSIGSLKLDDMKLLVDYQRNPINGNYWNVAFQNVLMAGHYRYFDDPKHLPEVDFDTVKLGDTDEETEDDQEQVAEEEDSKRVDPLADVIPQDLPAMHVHAKQVFLKGDDVGDWQFVLKPNKQGVVLNDLFVKMPGLTIDGIDNKERGAKIHWTRDGNDMKTEATTHISLSNQDGVKNLFGIERIVESEKTDIQGTVNWKGSPAMISFRRLQGDLSISSEKGRFLNSTASTDLMRVINVFNFTTWIRRLKLDFSDLYKKGISYDKVDGHVSLDQGKVMFNKPLMMVGPSGRFELQGTIDSVQNMIDASLIVTLPVNQNATWIAALAAGLPIAAGVWAVSKIFGDQIDKLSSVSYTVSGSLDDPDVKFVRLLPELSKEDKAANKTETEKSGASTQETAD